MKDFSVIPTWDMSEDEWLEQRRQLGIGGSDAGTILGVNKYKSPYALWMDKLGLAEKDDAGMPAKWGHRLEPVIADAYAEDYNVAVVGWPVILVSKENPFMFANLDYLEVEPSEKFPVGKVTEWRSTKTPPGVYGIVECKTSGIASPGTVHHWNNNAIPTPYYYQGIHYSVVTGIPTVTFVALLAGKGLVTRDMPIVDEDFAHVVAAESMFWDLVQSKTPPEVDGSESTENAQRQRFSEVDPGSVYDGGTALQDAWNEFQSLKDAAEEADAKRKEARAKILEMVGNAEVGISNGQKLFTYKAGKQVESVDSLKLKEGFPDVWEAVKKIRPGSRVLRKSAG
jgi:putative phage-type endonuclease